MRNGRVIAAVLLPMLVVAILHTGHGHAIRAQESETGEKASPALVAVGGLSAAFMVQTQLTLGLLADAQANKLYDKKTAADLLTLQFNLIDGVAAQLDDLEQADLIDSDRAALEAFQDANELLKAEAQALRTYWTTSADDDKQTYLARRTAAKSKIDAILGQEDATDSEDE